MKSADHTTPLALELGPRARPSKDWLYSTGGRPHDPATDPLAAEAVRHWRPDAPATPEALRPGWAGLASYRVPFADGERHLKLAMAPKPDQADAYRKLCKEAVGEAGRAAWAGRLGLGPRVHHVVPHLGAFFSDFVPGRVPTPAEAEGPGLKKNLDLLARLHRQDATEVPEGGHVNWLLKHVGAGDCLTNATEKRPSALQHALLQVESGLTRYLERTSSVLVPIHDDYKPDNTLLQGEVLTLLDWNNLRVADPAIDLGHFATMVDVPASRLESDIVLPYLAEQRRAGAQHLFAPAALKDATRAYTALFRLRNVVFYDQWAGTRPKADYVRHQLVDDVASLRQDLFAELGLRPSLAKEAA